jgi:hypothetical protein
MAVDVSQTVYDLIKNQRDAAAANAANSTTIISQEQQNKTNWEQQAADLTDVLADLRVV